MCDVCGGITNDEYLQRLVDNIRTHGWTLQFIEGDETIPDASLRGAVGRLPRATGPSSPMA